MMERLSTQGGVYMQRLISKAAIVATSIFTSVVALASQPEAVPGEYIVQLKPSASFLMMNTSTLSQALGGEVRTVLPDENIVLVKKPMMILETYAVKSLNLNEIVERAEPNFIYRANKSPNDPKLKDLWGMINTGQYDGSQNGIAGFDVNAEKAWDIQTGNKDLVVAVIDTGVDYNHPDLKENMWTNEAERTGKAGVDDDGNGYVDDIYGYDFASNRGDSNDDQGHGSHCAGTIGAKGDNGVGIAGVVWDVKIMGVKFLDANGSGTLENALKAIDYATKMGAKIMSNSWGGGGFSETLKASIERSNAAGSLFVAAAGNDYSNNDSRPMYPASYQIPNVISVAAINNKGQLANFSNYGKASVHVGAPGVNITSSTNGGYYSFSGTSMATPHVSGVAALILSNEPDLTNLELKQRLIATAKPIAGLKGKVSSSGMVDAYAALTNTLPEPDPNDPARWAYQEFKISTEHPYKAKENQTFEVSVSGAKEIALYFEKFDTESGYDTVKIYNRAGELITTMMGLNNDTWSPNISGDYAKIVFQSDDSLNKYGFDLTKVGYR